MNLKYQILSVYLKKLPLNTADEPGTWIETTIGESAFANYMPDENTIGLWRMEESRQSQEEEISSDSTGLDALWHMNNSYTDSSDNSNNGTPSGNPQFTTSSVRGSHAVSFDGSDDYVSTGLTPSNPITVSAWVNIDEYPPGESPDSRGFILRSGAAIYFSIESSGEAQFKMYNGGSNSLNSTYSLNTSQWYHIVGTWDGTTGADSQKLYINGELNNSNAAYSTTYQDDTNGFTIGAQSTTYNHLDGSVDEVAVFNRVLDAEEIEMMYGAKIKDYSGNGNDGGGQGGSITQGKIGKAREFDGDNDYVEVTDFSGYSIYNISAWVNVGEINNSMGAQSIVNFKTTNPQAYLSLGDNSGYATDETITIGDGDSGDYGRTYTRDTYPSGWHYISVNWNSSESRYDIYVDGIAQTVYAGTSAGHARLLTDQDILRIGQSRNSNYLDGIIDELQISNTSRTAEEIRQAYEIGRRTHPITIEFADKLDSNDLLTDSSDPGFRLANEDGQVNKLHEGEKVIVKENYGGTEYIAQGIVDYVDTSSGSVTVSSWDANSTFPSNGFTTEADVFKWQREYWDISGILDSQVNAAIQLTFRITNNGQGRNFWLDDLVYGGAYMSDSTGTSISSTTDRYFQYRAIFSSWDPYVSSSLSSVTLDYTENNSPSTPSNSTPTDGAITETLNPELTASAFSDTDGDAHGASQWQISTSEGSFDSNIVWDSGTTETNLRSIVVNTSNGTFQGALSGATELTDETTYYWRVRYQDDHSNPDWSSYSTITSFTAVDVESTFYCFLEPATDNSQIVVNWTDNNSSEDGYEIERNVNAAGFSHLTTEAANSTSYTDTDVSTGNTYQYRIAPVSGTTTGEWCTTDTVTLGTGDFEFEGINMEGINLD
jgi:hypothetical protein